MTRTEAEWQARERELLETSNRYQQEARDARAALAAADALTAGEREPAGWTTDEQLKWVSGGRTGTIWPDKMHFADTPIYLSPPASELETRPKVYCSMLSTGVCDANDRTLAAEARLAEAEADTLAAEAELRIVQKDRDEARAEIERMTPKFVAYEYLEAPSGRETAEARLPETLKALEFYGDQDRWREFAADQQNRALERDTGSEFGDDMGATARRVRDGGKVDG